MRANVLPPFNRKKAEATLRRLHEITGETEFYFVGSNAIVASVKGSNRVAATMTLSPEIDVFLGSDDPEIQSHIDHMMGEGSTFNHENGFYVDTVDASTAALPRNWRARAVEWKIPYSQAITIRAISPDVNDLAVSKLLPRREKDITYLSDGVLAKIFDPDTIAVRFSSLDPERTAGVPVEIFEGHLKELRRKAGRPAIPICLTDLCAMHSLLEDCNSIGPSAARSRNLVPRWMDPSETIARTWESYANANQPFTQRMLADHFQVRSPLAYELWLGDLSGRSPKAQKSREP